jgi:hypothetical protein
MENEGIGVMGIFEVGERYVGGEWNGESFWVFCFVLFFWGCFVLAGYR